MCAASTQFDLNLRYQLIHYWMLHFLLLTKYMHIIDQFYSRNDFTEAG